MTKHSLGIDSIESERVSLQPRGLATEGTSQDSLDEAACLFADSIIGEFLDRDVAGSIHRRMTRPIRLIHVALLALIQCAAHKSNTMI